MIDNDLIDRVIKADEAATDLLIATAEAFRNLLLATAGEWDSDKRATITDLGNKIDALRDALKVD